MWGLLHNETMDPTQEYFLHVGPHKGILLKRNNRTTMQDPTDSIHKCVCMGEFIFTSLWGDGEQVPIREILKAVVLQNFGYKV